jgi:two-component system response regulator GlrR
MGDPLCAEASRRILVIEDRGAHDLEVFPALVADLGSCCQRIDWGGVDPQNLSLSGAGVVVAAVGAATAQIEGVFEALCKNPIDIPLLAIVPIDAGDGLLRLIARIADEVIFAPVRPIELRHRLARVLREPRGELELVRRRLREELGLTQLVGRDPVFLRAVERVPRFARTEVSVLITGETGTGKEMCARALHHLGRRRSFPFVTIDCGAVPEQLFENELFGHARGAFTGADREHRGLVAMAEGGTLFLDEIDALSLGAQAKLLRFLQERTFRALGSERVQRADVKVIGATNQDLDACVKSGRFRSDLYFRLNVLRIPLPPLRERSDDIELLAQAFLDECGKVIEGAPRAFSAAALRLLRQYRWPGNIRELGNVVQRAAVACEGERILPEHLELGPGEEAASATGEFRAARAAAVAAFERHYVEEMLRKHGGNVTHAAREARQDRRAFGRFIKKYQIKRQAL